MQAQPLRAAKRQWLQWFEIFCNRRYGDLRRDMGFEIRAMWFNLGKSLGVQYQKQKRRHFVPTRLFPTLLCCCWKL